MKNLISLFIVLNTFASTANAQIQDTSKIEKVNWIYRQATVDNGLFFNNLDAVNELLSQNGLRAIPQNNHVYFASSTFQKNKNIFDVGLYGLRNSDNYRKASADISTKYLGWGWSISYGYALWQNSKFRFYPYVGLLTSHAYIFIQDHSPLSSLNGIINGQRREGVIRSDNGSLNSGFSIVRVLAKKNRKWDCPQDSRYTCIGLKAGYIFQLGQSKAKYNGQPLTDTKICFKGPYIMITFGIGNKIRRVKWR